MSETQALQALSHGERRRREPFELVRIEFGAVRNGSGKGFLPGLWVNGHQKLSMYADRVGYDREMAHEMARAAAEEEASRYLGDWQIEVCEQRAPAITEER